MAPRFATDLGPAEWPSAEWWRGFGSDPLDSFIAQAQQANNDIAAAIARVREADAQARIAGSPLLPTVSLDGTAAHQRASASTNRSSGSGGGLKTATLYTPSLAASYQVDFWGKNQAALSAADSTAQADRFDQASVELQVVTSVATSYFQALEARDRLAVAQNNLADAETVLKGLQLQEKVGTATALDVAQQVTTVEALNATVPPLEEQRRQSIDALAILIGASPEGVEITSGTLADLSFPIVAPGLPSDLLRRRPDIAAAEAQLQSANANIAVARAAFYPTITLTGTAGFASTQLKTAFDPMNGVFSLASSLAQPIFDGGALEGQLDLSKATYDEMLANYRKSVISAFGNVEDALIAVQQTIDQVDRQDRATKAARRAHEIAVAQLRAGTINILTVLNTEGALYTAEDNLVQARFARLQAIIALFSALGGGWQQS